VQDAYFRLQSAPTITSSFKAQLSYLFQIVRNLAIDHYRKQALELKYSGTEEEGLNVVIHGASPETSHINFNTLENIADALTDRTKAVIPVHLYGQLADVDAIRSAVAGYDVSVLEDAAQSLGSHYPDGRHIGSVGKVGSFSFSVPKVITTGQGGCLITNDGELAERLRKLKDFGRAAGGADIHQSIGYNFKFTDLQACVGIEQMKKLDWRIERKKEMLVKYQQALRGLGSVKFFEQDLINTTPWFIDILCERRSDLQEHLKQRGIGTRAMYPPINKQEAYQRVGDHPVSELVGRQGLWLPSSSQLTDQQIKTVCDAVAEFYS